MEGSEERREGEGRKNAYTPKFRLNVFIASASGGQKPQFWATFDIWGLVYPSPFTDEGQIWCATAHPRCTLTRQISSRLVYSVALLRRKTPNFAVFWTLAFCGVDTRQQSEKVEHGCTTTNLPLPNASKSFLYSNAFMAKSGVQTLTFTSVTD